MFRRHLVTSLALTAVLAGGLAPDTMAAVQRTFVASYGNDAQPCSIALPCRAFAAAIAQTQANGEVIVLDSAGYGPATISQAVSIIAPPGIYAGISVTAGGPGMVVAAGSGKVTLRGLSINNITGGTSGIAFTSGTSLYVDNCTVTNFPIAGIAASVAASSSVFVTNSTFRDNGTGGVFTATAGTLTISIENSMFGRNGTGLDFRDGTVGTVHFSTMSGGTTGLAAVPPTAGKTATIEVRDSTISDNSGAGVTATQSGAAVPVNLVSLVSTQISGNGTGVQVTGVNSSAYVSDSAIVRNGTGVSAVSSGTIVSGQDNRLVANTVNGAFSSSVPKI
jgi:hypothetical protein